MIRQHNQPYLEKYTGKASRHKCPKCGDAHSFAYYLDGNTGQVIDKNVGRCNHESGCGYHYTPKQFFIDNPVEKERFVVPVQIKPKQQPKRETSYIPFQYVEKSVSYNSSFIYFLCGLFDRYSLESPTIEKLMQDYALGATKDGSIIYWQIDTKGKVRTGKVMKYDPHTGHRIKSGGGINWIHSIMKRQDLLPEDFNLVQCLFGEHLLRMYPDKVVALVESEKSALIASGVYPDYIWLATGGKSQLSIDKLKVLKGRTVIMFPDVDGFEYWSNKAKEVETIGCMLPDNSPEAFSQYHSPDKVSYRPTGNRIFSLHYDNPEAYVCSVSTVPTLPCRSDSVRRPARDGFRPPDSQSRPAYGQDFP